MKNLLTAISGALALTAALTSGAHAGLLFLTDFTVDGSTISVPGGDLTTASQISATTWTVGLPAPDPALDLAVGDTVSISNPISLSGTGMITLSWDSGTYSDTLTITGKNAFGNSIQLVAVGELTGPGIGANSSELDLSFTQSGGAGHEISGSASYSASTVPEPATWAMLGLGFASLGLLGWTRSRRSSRFAF